MNYRAEGGIAVCLHFFGRAMLCRERVKHRAIIRAIPEYFVWPETEQERYRLRVPKEQDFLIRQAMLRSLFGIQVDTEKAVNEALNGFNDEKYLLLSSTLLPFQGIGEDDFFLNQWLADGALDGLS